MPLLGTRGGGSARGFGRGAALAAIDTGAMFEIGMVQVGSGGSATISFTSIPSTYTHLQIRLSAILSANDSPQIFFNNDTTSTNYNNHILQGNGSSANANYYNASYIYSLNN